MHGPPEKTGRHGGIPGDADGWELGIPEGLEQGRGRWSALTQSLLGLGLCPRVSRPCYLGGWGHSAQSSVLADAHPTPPNADPSSRPGVFPTSPTPNTHLPGRESKRGTCTQRRGLSMSWEEAKRQPDNQEGAWSFQDTTASREEWKEDQQRGRQGIPTRDSQAN